MYKKCLYIIIQFLVLSLTETIRSNAIYDPLKGSYMASFKDPSGKHTCYAYFVHRTMFFIDGCNSSHSFVRGFNFTLDGKTIPRVVYTSFGVLLEVPKINWKNEDDRLILNITQKNFSKEISLANLHWNYKYFAIPSKLFINSFNSSYAKSEISNVVMNSKIIAIFHFNFENYYDCNAHFWVGIGSKPDKNGSKIPDENGSLKPLKDYYKETIVLTLPRMDLDDPTSPQMTMYDIDYLGIYCPDTQHVYDFIPINLRQDRSTSPHVALHPPFIFDRFFLGEKRPLCLPSGTYSPELNFDDSKSKMPFCIGSSSTQNLNEQRTILLSISATLLVYRFLSTFQI